MVVDDTGTSDSDSDDDNDDGGELSDSELVFHADLYDCGDDPSCGVGVADTPCEVGEFVQELCPEEGCYSSVFGTASVAVPQVDGAGPYFVIGISSDDRSFDAGCSGVFIMGTATDEATMTSTVTSMFDEGGTQADTESDETQVEPDEEQAGGEWCDTFGSIPYPLEADLTVVVPEDAAQVSCPSPTTIRVAGGTLTVSIEGEGTMFSGVRFEVESEASLVFATDAATEFTGIKDLQAHGGVLNVAEGGTVDMMGPTTFHDNSVQVTADTFDLDRELRFARGRWGRGLRRRGRRRWPVERRHGNGGDRRRRSVGGQQRRFRGERRRSME
ncbi:unnamed protein product [Scytosiphon promiscuus]